ncbi:hypothetical protein PENNAL_c0094G00191, partial [Penicillium nalgiovense]
AKTDSVYKDDSPRRGSISLGGFGGFTTTYTGRASMWDL